VIGASEEDNLFHDCGWACIELEQTLHFCDLVAELLMHLFDNAPLCVLTIELSGTRLHGSLAAVLEKYRCS